MRRTGDSRTFSSFAPLLNTDSPAYSRPSCCVCSCNASIIIGTTSVRQVEECVAAFKLELPEELMRAIDTVHEEFRSPTQYY